MDGKINLKVEGKVLRQRGVIGKKGTTGKERVGVGGGKGNGRGKQNWKERKSWSFVTDKGSGGGGLACMEEIVEAKQSRKHVQCVCVCV